MMSRHFNFITTQTPQSLVNKMRTDYNERGQKCSVQYDFRERLQNVHESV